MTKKFTTPIGYLELTTWQIHYYLAVTGKNQIEEAVNHFVVQCDKFGISAEKIFNMMKEPPTYRSY